MNYLLTLFKLLIAHAVCDFPLQTPFMAQAKNRHNKPIDNSIPAGQKPARIWPYVLLSHALVHAGGVWVVTGYWAAALFMFTTHLLIDAAKCENWTTVHIDQFLHLVVIGVITTYPMWGG